MILRLCMMINICLIFLNKILSNNAPMGLPYYRPDGAGELGQFFLPLLRPNGATILSPRWGYHNFAPTGLVIGNILFYQKNAKSQKPYHISIAFSRTIACFCHTPQLT